MKYLLLLVMVSIPLAWEHPAPEDVMYYRVYMSDIEGYFGKPYSATTKLPTDQSPFTLKLPVVSGSRTIYLKVKAVNEIGESGWSNEKEIRMVFEVNDVP